MSLLQRFRGIVGTALMWGGLGVVVGVPLYPAVFRPWPLNAATLPRAVELFLRWEAGMFIWGVVTGLVFSMVMLTMEGRRSWSSLSTRRLTAWGAVAGAFFPALLSVRPLQHGSSGLYFGSIIAVSAIAGALWARGSLAMARRVSDDTTAAALGAPQPSIVSAAEMRERVG